MPDSQLQQVQGGICAQDSLVEPKCSQQQEEKVK